MRNKTLIFIRILLGVLSIVSIIWGSLLLLALVVIAGLALYTSYYEIMVWGITLDALFGVSNYRYTIIAAILLMIAIVFRQRVRDTMYV